jgi:hypothetical protein
MKVYDCFTFFNELDLLEIRLNELDDVVDYFVLVEGEHTFQNNQKPLHYLNNQDRFKKFKDKIIRVEVPANQFGNNAWDNEQMSWNSAFYGLSNANDDDIIVISALDEIPKKEALIEAINSPIKPCTIITQFYYFYLNTKYYWDSRYITNWPGPYVTTYSKMNKSNMYGAIKERMHLHGIYGGWHFSYLGDANNVYNKVHSFSHSEYNGLSHEFYKERIDNLQDVFGRSDTGFHSFEDVVNLPKYVQTNIEKYKKYFRN